MSNAEDIRGWAMVLPEVTEKQHHLFKVAKWQVQGRTFLGMGKDETTAVFCVSETDANKMAAADPDTCAAVRRQDARKSFLGVQIKLDRLAGESLRSLVEDAWRQQAPNRLVAEFDRGTTASPTGGLPVAAAGGTVVRSRPRRHRKSGHDSHQQHCPARHPISFSNTP